MILLWAQAQKTAAANKVADVERERAEEERTAKEELKQVLYASQLQLAETQLIGGQPAIASNLLDSQIPVENAPIRVASNGIF